MDWLRLLQILGAVIVIGAGLGAGYGGFYYAFKSKKTKLQQEQIDSLKENYDKCDAQHKDSLAMIHKLEGKLEVIKDVPLQQIAQTMAELANSNQKILELLANSAIIAAEDRDGLLNQHVNTQLVEHQEVKR